MLEALIGVVEPALREAGDLDRAAGLLEHAIGDNGAGRQRAAYERAGTVEAVVDDVIARTEQSWLDHRPARELAHDSASSEGLGSAHG